MAIATRHRTAFMTTPPASWIRPHRSAGNGALIAGNAQLVRRAAAAGGTSGSAEQWRTLFAERRDRLVSVFRRKTGFDGGELPLQLFIEAALQARAEQALGERKRDRRSGGQPLGVS